VLQNLLLAGGAVAAAASVWILLLILDRLDDHLGRRRFPLFVATRCEIADTSPPTVRFEGRLTDLRGKFFPNRAGTTIATLTATADGFAFTTAAPGVTSRVIERSDMTYAETGSTDTQNAFLLCVILAGGLTCVNWSVWPEPDPEGLAVLLIALGLGGALFDFQASYLLVVKGGWGREIALRLTAVDRRIPFERAVEAVFLNAHSGFDVRHATESTHRDIRRVHRTSSVDGQVSRD